MVEFGGKSMPHWSCGKITGNAAENSWRFRFFTPAKCLSSFFYLSHNSECLKVRQRITGAFYVGNGWEWGLLGLLLIVSQWIIPENSLRLAQVRRIAHQHLRCKSTMSELSFTEWTRTAPRILVAPGQRFFHMSWYRKIHRFAGHEKDLEPNNASHSASSSEHVWTILSSCIDFWWIFLIWRMSMGTFRWRRPWGAAGSRNGKAMAIGAIARIPWWPPEALP